MKGYEFQVYPTESCPKSQTEWDERSLALNCTKKNGYMCFPNEKFTELLEFCYFIYSIKIDKGYFNYDKLYLIFKDLFDLLNLKHVLS